MTLRVKREVKHWTFLTNHGVVFFHIMQNPGDTIRRIADRLRLAERTVAGILHDLKEAGYVSVTKEGRRNRYIVQPDLPMRHHSMQEYSVEDFFFELSSGEEGPPSP
ncbi:MAG: AsnC family transcriptional regulator [Chloroflexi bacterium]|nr:AsnC family transcriptional regulator [Chloroflexota bacterium]